MVSQWSGSCPCSKGPQAFEKKARELCQATAGQLVFCQPCLIRRALDLGTAWGETGRSQCSQKSLLQPGTVACGSLT